jgi:intracellular sulfur oxidation DsrE/DsrF family protein
MKTTQAGGLRRRSALKLVGAMVAAITGAAATTKAATPASADQLRLNDPLYHFDAYEAIVNRSLTIRQVFEWPSLANRELWANAVNALNSFQFAYSVPPDQIQLVVQAYAGSTAATFDDYIWNKYGLGQALQIQDGRGDPATSNPFLHSNIPASQVTPPPADQNDPYYFDSSIEGLQRRGVLFLTCNNSLRGAAGSAFQGGRNPDNLTAAQITAEIQAHLVPGALLVPAGVGELVRLQDKGYRLVVNS